MKSLPSWARVCAISAVIVFVAAFLPWASLFGITVSGIKGDGQITAVVAVLGAVALLYRRHPRVALAVQSVAAAIVTLIGLFDMTGVSSIGLYLTLFAGAAWIVGAVLGWRAVRAADVPAISLTPLSPPG